MDFQILGSLEVRRDGRPVPLRAAKQRALLAILLLHAGEVVGRDRLIDGLWGEGPPETASHALQVYVAQLRKALEPRRARGVQHEILLTHPSGYLLRVEPGALDAQRFERGLAEGREAMGRGDAAAAARRLREALGLWRGPALADFTYEPFAQTEIARLEELRLAALDARFEADLTLGGHAQLVGELEALIHEHPFRERPRGQLMLALYRCGRQADALAAYEAARRTLVEELGIEPGPSLRSLQQAILDQDPEIEPERAPARTEAAGPALETRKLVTVLIADSVAPTGIDPEARRERDDRDLAIAASAVARHGGTVESVLGGELVAVFGVPRVHEDDALRALRAAVDLRAGLPAVRVGVASGEVVTVPPDAPGPSVCGDAVAHAARLGHAACAGEILVAKSTRELAGRLIRAAPAARVEGSAAWQLLGLVPDPAPLTRLLDTPMVGREAELSQLRQMFDRVVDLQRLHLCTVLGTAGVGKSRLVEELCARVADEATVVAGRCISYGDGITFWPLVEMARRLAAARPLAELLAGVEHGDRIPERVADAAGAGDGVSSREEIFEAFRRLFEALARERPLVVVFEDIHWAEPTLLDFIEYLAEAGRDEPTMVVCLARPELLEERPSWAGGKRSASSLFLERLSEADGAALVQSLATDLDDPTRARLLETAEGNPLFLEQLVATLAEQPSPGVLPIPPTIQALLTARLDRLGPGERATISRAAVVGRELREAAVVELLPEDARPFAGRHLEALVAKELVRPVRSAHAGDNVFRFRHVLIQQAAYGCIPKRLRGTLHERLADWLETDGTAAAESTEIVGYHLEQAFRCRQELRGDGAHPHELARRAADRLAAAGGRAFRRGDMPASAGLFARAAALLPSDDPGRLELLPDLGFALIEVGDFGGAAGVLDEAVERARATGRRGVEWRASVKRAHLSMFTSPELMDAGGLCRHAERAVRVLQDLEDDAGLTKAWLLLAEGRVLEGRLRSACGAADRAAEHARRAGSHREQAWALGEYAWSIAHGLTPVAEAIRRIEGRRARAAGNPLTGANLPAWIALCEAMAGRFDDARARIAHSLVLTSDLGLRWQAAVHELLRGRIELLAGCPAAGERSLCTARDAFADLGDRWLLATVAVHLAGALHAQGRHDDALALTEAFDGASPPADLECEIKRREARARALARCERGDEAERVAREAVAIASGTEFLEFRADALMGLADVLALAGRAPEAVESAEEAALLYERKGIVASGANARARCEELRAEAARGVRPA